MSSSEPTEPAEQARPGNRPLLNALVAAVTVLALAVAFLAGQLVGGPADPSPVAGAAATGSAAATPSATAATAAKPAPTGPVPQGATGFGGPIVVNPQAPVGVPTLDLYEDPQCPVCKEFEQIYGPTIADLLATNRARLVVHTMTFLDGNLRNDSSARAANASFCAADQGRFLTYVSAVYDGQPAREGEGWTDAQLEAFAGQVGVADLATWRTCQTQARYAAHIAALEKNSEKAGVSGTPTLKVNGTLVRLTGNPVDITAVVTPAKTASS
ncbi:MAG: thioredoxin domain-containing protein [Candidatus Phosphoribacter sp.]|nr:thioredoxin domain-containing protein [Actinomycetales bacterium]